MELSADLENRIEHKAKVCDEQEANFVKETQHETEFCAAFTGIVQRYYEKILKFCGYALGGNWSLAEDCTQDIFLVLYERMGSLKDYDKIGGWLYKTADHISKQYAASVRRDRKTFAAVFGGPEDNGEEAPVNRIIAGNITREEDRITEEKAIDRAAGEIRKRLKPFDERILELAFRKKYPLKEVAARLNISLSAVKSRTSRLRQKISALARELLTD
ncbi:MAG: sigma-70 family RNA polymerase sigma factor [Spirochaetaceae bacterium]|jgi:RNA polymerase sigma-70 factor (ECF subfamily)|nr:sigma-70 family RNA polymerase sigma factor [Spirochaetaceae bacterium]